MASSPLTNHQSSIDFGINREPDAKPKTRLHLRARSRKRRREIGRAVGVAAGETVGAEAIVGEDAPIAPMIFRDAILKNQTIN